MLCASLDGRGVWGRMDACVCLAESFHCSPETITTLLISYSPVQNGFGVKNKTLKNKLFGKKKKNFFQGIMLVSYKHTNMARGQCPAPTGPPRGRSAASEGSRAKLESPGRVKNGTVGNIRTHREEQRQKEKLGWGSMNLCH